MRTILGTFLALWLVGCGTVAGNPRKPVPNDPLKVDEEIPDDEQPVDSSFYLPKIEFDLVDATFSTESALTLNEGNDPEDFTGSTTTPFSLLETEEPIINPIQVFNTQGRRIQRVVKELNLTSQRINNILKTKVTIKPDRVQFKNKGQNGVLSGEIVKKSDTDFEALICSRGVPTQHIKWSKNNPNVELWRDFTLEQATDQDLISLISHVVFQKQGDGNLQISIASQGTWSDPEEETPEGTGLLEKIVGTKITADNSFTLKSLQDRFKGPVPSTPEGDTYLTGILYPRSDGKAGFDPEYVGYNKTTNSAICKRGFDENSPSLWTPQNTDKRFCLGRNRGGLPFSGFPAFAELIEKMEPIGLVKSPELTPVTMPMGLSCDIP
jgi:hypothetical protein